MELSEDELLLSLLNKYGRITKETVKYSDKLLSYAIFKGFMRLVKLLVNEDNTSKEEVENLIGFSKELEKEKMVRFFEEIKSRQNQTVDGRRRSKSKGKKRRKSRKRSLR
jgi:hypothetical protein